MRSARRISSTPGEWADMRAREANRNRVEAQRLFAAARERGDEWYTWIASGCPRYTPEQYALVEAQRAARSRGRQR